MLTIPGDPAGLHQLADTLRARAGAAKTDATALSTTVDDLIADNGWSGTAADTFRGAWGQDAAALGELTTVLGLCAGVLDELGRQLTAARNQLATAYDAARRAGVVLVHGVPATTQPSAAQATAGTHFNQAASAALTAADVAQSTADSELSTLLAEVNPDATSAYPTVGQLAGVGALLRGYYSLPSHRVELIRSELESAEQHRRQVKHDTKSTKGLSREEAASVRALRKQVTDGVLELRRTTDAAERLATHFKGGKLVGTTIGDLLRSTGGELETVSRAARLGESVPVLDVAAATLATWDMAKHDHEKGWSWTHAVVVEGGANATGLVVGTATDFIPVAGPFLAPFTAYGSAAFVSEAAHEGHFTKNLAEHGPLLAPSYIAWDASKAVWDNDVVGVGKGIVDGVEHPAEAAKGLWKEAKWLVGG